MSMLFSNMLLQHMDDIVAFRLVFIIGQLSYGVLIAEYFFAHVPQILTYIAIVTLTGSIGAQININLLIMELRVPPNNVAAV